MTSRKRAADPGSIPEFRVRDMLMTLLPSRFKVAFLYMIEAKYRDVQLRIGCRQLCVIEVMLSVYRNKLVGDLSFQYANHYSK